MSKPKAAGRGRRCPICGRPEQAGHAPFCSSHCADIDLGRWLGGGYRIATDERPGEGDRDPDEEPA